MAVAKQSVSKEWLFEQHVEKGMTYQAIGNTLGVTRERVRQLLRKHDIPNTRINRAPTFRATEDSFNEHYFDLIDSEEKAYWLGFVAAKARVSISANGARKDVSINMKNSRLHHLEMFKSVIGLEKEIGTTKAVTRGVQYSGHLLSMFSNHLSNVLQFYGITSPKYEHVEIPEIPPYLIFHCFRGYFESKGFAWESPSNGLKLLIFYGSKNILEDFSSCLLDYDIKLPKPYKGPGRNYHRMTIPFTAGRKILDLLYEDATVYLPDRKEHFESVFGRREF